MYNTIYDTMYAGFGIILVVILGAILGRSLRRATRASGTPPASDAACFALASGGTLLSVIVGFGLNALRTQIGDLAFQQWHFGAFYVGFALVLVGIDRLGLTPHPETGVRTGARWTVARSFAWAGFAGATVLAAGVLLVPSEYRVELRGDVRYVQLAVFYLPLVATLLVGLIALPMAAVTTRTDPARRRSLWWFAAYAGLMLLVVLREATVIASTGEPIVDLLVAFVPFTLGAICLFVAARSPRGGSLLAMAAA
jgi:hypothetical protein